MLKKTLLSLAIATSTVGLTACNISSTADNNAVATDPVNAGTPGYEASSTSPVFSVARSNLPVNIDFLFADAGDSDGTASVGNSAPPVTAAINDLAGFSTSAAIDLAFSASLDPSTVVAGNSVFLIKLLNSEDDASIDALDIDTILAASPVVDGTPIPFSGSQPGANFDYVAQYVEMDNGDQGTSATIRILPTTPLDPKTKYLVVVTNGVKDVNGDPVTPSSEYEYLRGDQDLLKSALVPVRAAIKGWDAMAGGFLASATQGAVTSENVVLSYTMTTGAGPDVLKNYAAPSLFVANQLPLASAEGLMEGVQAGATTLVAQGVAVGSNTLQGLNPGDTGYLDPTNTDVIAAMKLTSSYAGAIYSQLSAADLTGVIGVPLSINGVVNRPAPRAVSFINTAMVDGAINAADTAAATAAAEAAGTEVPAASTLGASPARFLGTADSATRYIQGQIELPDFLGDVTVTSFPQGVAAADAISLAMMSDSPWQASTALGAILDAALGNPAGSTPPQDIDGTTKLPDGTTNVTYRYPFPKDLGTNYAPVMVTMPAAFDYSVGGANPAGSDCTNAAFDDGFPVVIYVHGIRGARTNGLGYSAGLAANCVATVAIDLPLHGIAPITTDNDGDDVANAVLPFSVEPGNAALTASPWAGVAAASGAAFENLAERHGNITQDGNGIRLAMDFDGSDETPVAGKSGSTIINLLNFSRSRDNMRQAVADLLNLNASLENIDTALGGDKLDLDKVYVAGHSLGAIFASTFVAVNNDSTIQAANSSLNKVQGIILANGGGQLTKLLENSPSFAPTIIGSLAASGIAQGSSDFEKFMYVFQSSIDSVDPVNTGSLLADTGTPIVLFNMVGGAALPEDGDDDDSLRGDKISMPTALKAVGAFLPDQTVPNFDYFANGDTNPYRPFASALGLQEEVATAKAPMAGTNGLAKVMGLEVVNAGTDVSTLSTPTQVVSRFNTGTHSTFANADAPAAFTEMLTQSLKLIGGSFETVNTTVLEVAQ